MNINSYKYIYVIITFKKKKTHIYTSIPKKKKIIYISLYI
jgi:hypothetical protein